MSSIDSGPKATYKNKRSLLIAIGSVVVVILIIIGVPYYQNYIAPFNRTVITVDNTEISTRYFLDRTRLAGADPMSMLQTLTEEQLVKLMAPQYGIQVTDADVDAALRSLAGGGTGEVSDVEFKEWYRQWLNDSKMSDSQYREIVRTRLLTGRLKAYLGERVPAVAEQVHLHAIAVLTYEEAQNAAARLEAGEDFASLAREVSMDTGTRENGGDMGWLPPVASIFEEEISALEVNRASPPIPYYSQTGKAAGTAMPEAYYILLVSEEDSARPLEDEHREILRYKAFELWFLEESRNHTIKYDFDSETYAWMLWQLQKE